MLYLYGLLIFLVSLYSYTLIDLNLTLFNHPLWNQFREQIIIIGYFRRDISWYLFLSFIILLFVFFFYLLRHYKKYRIFHIALLIGIILLFSYPFLSHDFFNYMFDAKIFTYYHKSPYLFKALDFPVDNWTRFMHWTHRTYPYGPTFLLLTFIPSFLGMGKFAVTFFLFKALNVFFYLLAVYLLEKINKRCALIYAIHPLVIVEGLISGHNDLIAVSLGIIGIYLLFRKKKIFPRIILLFSGLIKYTTLPYVLFSNNKKSRWNILASIGIIGILGYLTFRSEIQPWYFLLLFPLLPYFQSIIERLTIFFIGLLLSYYPYIRLGGWDTAEKVTLKHWIISVFFALNAIYLVFIFLQKYRNRKMV